MELQKFISDNLNLQSCKNEKERYDKLTQSIENFNDVLAQMKRMQEDLRVQYAKKWHEEVSKAYPQVEFFDDYKNEQCFGQCIIKKLSGKNVLLFVGYDGQLYCQVEFEDRDEITNTPIMNLENILNEKNGHCIWKYYKNDLDGVFECFKQALEELLKL